MELDDEIAAPDFATRFPELHHYTDLNGLMGILSTNTLWATHFAHLNDRAEMQALRRPMIEVLQSRVVSRVRSRILNRQVWRAFRKTTDIEHKVSIFVGAVFGTSFEPGPTEPMAEPFITSFCTHPHGSYESQNGLLSQWRAYGGKDGRFCLVFDTRRMINLLSKEWESYNYIYSKLIDVVYHTPEINIRGLFPDLIDFYAEHLANGITQRMEGPSREMIVEFIAAATRFKNQAFREEQEARIIVIRMPQHVSDLARDQKLPSSEKQDKPIRSKTRDGVEIPYVALFERDGSRLPIRRIIVGPTRNQDTSFADARAAIGRRFPLSRSETPFIG